MAFEIDFTTVDLSTLGDSFKQITSHIKGGFPYWDDLLERGNRFHKAMDHALLHLASFFDGFQKIAEHTAHSKGDSREIGTVLTNMAMWHKGQELRIREISSTIQHKLLSPLAERLEDWKKLEHSLERDQEKELAKAVKEAKEATKGTVKIEKKLEGKIKKEKQGSKVELLRIQLNHQQTETESKFSSAVAVAKKHLSRILVEERAWHCKFSEMILHVLSLEKKMAGDLSYLESVTKELNKAASNPHKLQDRALNIVEKVGSPPRSNPASSPSASSFDECSRSPSGTPPPPPPPPPTETPTGRPLLALYPQSPTPSVSSQVSSSASSVSAVEVMPAELPRLNESTSEIRRILPLQHDSHLSFSQSQPSLAFTPPVIRRHAGANQQLQDSVGIVASPRIPQRMQGKKGPPPVATKPKPHRDRSETTGSLAKSSFKEENVPRSNSFSEGTDTIAEEEEDSSPFLQAIKQARLKKAITNDRSTPMLQGGIMQRPNFN